MANNPMQQFSVHKIGPEIKIAGLNNENLGPKTQKIKSNFKLNFKKVFL